MPLTACAARDDAARAEDDHLTELQAADLVGERLELLDVAAHHGRRREPAQSIPHRLGVPAPERGILHPKAIEEVVRLEEGERLLGDGELERVADAGGGLGRGAARWNARAPPAAPARQRGATGSTAGAAGWRRLRGAGSGFAGAARALGRGGAASDLVELRHLAHMGRVAREVRAEPRERDLDRRVVVGGRRRQAQNVRVELLPTLARRVGVRAQGRPDTADLVGRDGGADGIAADEHAGLHEVAEHGLPHDTCVVRIVDGLGREGAEVQHHVPVGLEGER